mgnify:CR=1 FL=1
MVYVAFIVYRESLFSSWDGRVVKKTETLAGARRFARKLMKRAISFPRIGFDDPRTIIIYDDTTADEKNRFGEIIAYVDAVRGRYYYWERIGYYPVGTSQYYQKRPVQHRGYIINKDGSLGNYIDGD